MYDTGSEPKPLIASFGSLYSLLVPLSWLLIRCVAGGILLIHGYGKIGHIETVEGTMVRVGLGAPVFIAWLLTLTETLGAIAVILGFFTRSSLPPVRSTLQSSPSM